MGWRKKIGETARLVGKEAKAELDAGAGLAADAILMGMDAVESVVGGAANELGRALDKVPPPRRATEAEIRKYRGPGRTYLSPAVQEEVKIQIKRNRKKGRRR